MDYYIIPDSVMEIIEYYAEENVLSNNLSYQKYDILKTLDTKKIHTNENSTIDKFIEVFQYALEDLEGESYDEEEGMEDRENLYEILDALHKRKKAIQDIMDDVLKRREDCCY